ncbi:MAG: 2-oxoglutarate dehydrogenase E1 component [Gammaproteobacteria bacterium]|nr:2-oxoglutarate dehydrogenase E1 component [Gammaproteobacteria bacterium]
MQDNSMKSLLATSYLSGGNASYIEELYEIYLKNPDGVPQEWQNFFESLPNVSNMGTTDVSHADIKDYFLQLAKQPRAFHVPITADALKERKQIQVEKLIENYRRFGHLAAKIDPLGFQRPEVSELQLNKYNLSEADYKETFAAEGLMGKSQATLKDIYTKLRNVYTETIGAEYMYISNQEEVRWLQHYLEQKKSSVIAAEDKPEILKLLTAADGLERYLGNRFVGQKRFSLEGGDAFVPLLHEIINRSGSEGVKEVVIGMAHRGRLNVLVNVMGQSPEELFQEFEGRKDYGLTSGDVKYHLGFSSDVATVGGPVHLSLAFNPSHLEVISSVVMGSVRARQDRYEDAHRNQITAIQVHGDAAFAGQGIVMETLNMSQTNAYSVGGAIHIVINNQVGFTTSNPKDARSSLYCTDVAKMIEAPVFHVNGDDPEAVVFLGQLATDYRKKFGKDIVIDLVCYRLHGHNEADEPSATQPIMYQKIRTMDSPREIYAQKLIKEGIVTEAQSKNLVDEYREALDQGKQIIVNTVQNSQRKSQNWSQFIGQETNVVVDTSVSKETLKKLGKKLEEYPKNFELQRQVGNMMEARAQMTEGKVPLDWGYAETMAYATLLDEGYPIRITGQDCRRGTFGHRHAVLYDQKTGESYFPLAHLSKDQPFFHIYDSLLSEQAVVGFEYGYAKTQPNTFTAWEAQFGDFANGAQVVIDQFISSGWQKWKQLSGLVMLLPHGYEGMGPEHSSARLERYLQLCAQHNIQVCAPTTPAQIFHLLRRQMVRPLRLPLIIMTPKSLLRHKLAVSTLDDLAKGKFQLIIPEIDAIKADKVRKIVLCSGKVYYDLLIKRREENIEDIAIIRIEQLYPFPYDELEMELEKYKKTKEVVWCQEEPKNQGAWFIIRDRILGCLKKGQDLVYAGRPPSAAPAAGYPALHKKQQTELVNDALK